MRYRAVIRPRHAFQEKVKLISCRPSVILSALTGPVGEEDANAVGRRISGASIGHQRLRPLSIAIQSRAIPDNFLGQREYRGNT